MKQDHQYYLNQLRFKNQEDLINNLSPLPPNMVRHTLPDGTVKLHRIPKGKKAVDIVRQILKTEI